MADVYELLTRELGRERVLRAPEALEDYARDESRLGVFPPDAAVLCESRAEIELVLRLAAEHRIPVTPRGAGSGMTGGALPMRGGIVLSTERMQPDRRDRRSTIASRSSSRASSPATCRPRSRRRGCSTRPIRPASSSARSAATSPRTRAARARSSTASRATTLGLEVALMGGETLRLGRRTAKGVTGYDLTALFVGSEGTFGVTTELTVQLLGRPEGVGTFIAVLPDAVSAGRAVSESSARATGRARWS